jgi:hypothetical protein
MQKGRSNVGWDGLFVTSRKYGWAIRISFGHCIAMSEALQASRFR